jgi:hypothetical protein
MKKQLANFNPAVSLGRAGLDRVHPPNRLRHNSRTVCAARQILAQFFRRNRTLSQWQMSLWDGLFRADPPQ